MRERRAPFRFTVPLYVCYLIFLPSLYQTYPSSDQWGPTGAVIPEHRY